MKRKTFSSNNHNKINMRMIEFYLINLMNFESFDIQTLKYVCRIFFITVFTFSLVDV